MNFLDLIHNDRSICAEVAQAISKSDEYDSVKSKWCNGLHTNQSPARQNQARRTMKLRDWP